MESDDSVNRTQAFDDPDGQSTSMLSTWLDRAGMKQAFVYQELRERKELDAKASDRTFGKWFSSTKIAADDEEMRGDRVVAVARFFVRENGNRYQPVVLPQELETLLALYPELSARHKLQIKKLIYDLQTANGISYDDLFSSKSWREQFAEWTTFAFVVDKFFVIRAYSKYSMELAGLQEERAKYWYWWHRLASGDRKESKYSGQNSLTSLRGNYATVYYTQQMQRFMASTRELNPQEQARYDTLLKLLHKTTGFTDLWQQAEIKVEQGEQLPHFIPVPFFLSDQTLLWMLEVGAPIPNTDGFLFTVRIENDPITAEYLADIRRKADEPGRYSRAAYFIEDYADQFTPEQKLAMGVE